MGRLVWASQPLDETNGETGFVDIADEDLAEKLIKSGKVQDGWDHSDHQPIDGKAVEAYATRQLKSGGPRPKTADKEPDEPPPAKQPNEPAKEDPAPKQPDEPTAEQDDERRGRGRPPKHLKSGK